MLRFAINIAYIELSSLEKDGVLLVLCGIPFMLLSLLTAIFKPYKEDYMNYCELAMLFLFGIAAVFAYLWFSLTNPQSALATMLVLIALLPHIGLICYMVFVIFQLKTVKGRIIAKYSTDGEINIKWIVSVLARFKSTSRKRG